jgi:hypothetical protein
MNMSGKGHWNYFWGDKVKRKFKRIFSKSYRQKSKKELTNHKVNSTNTTD